MAAEMAVSAPQTGTVPLLEMEGISKRFAGVQALKGVSLSVWPGEVVALIGENGAGKSTLMKILGGVHQPDEGVIKIAGQPTVIQSVNDSTRAGVGFIHQELNVLDNIDVAGNVFLGGSRPRAGRCACSTAAGCRPRRSPTWTSWG